MSGSKARSTFRRNMAAVILKKMVRNQRSMMPLSGTSEVREENFARATGTLRRDALPGSIATQ